MTCALVFPVHPLVGADVAFDVVFGAFVLAVVVLAVVTLRWAVQRDRVGRARWLRQRREAAGPGGTEPPPAANGHGPRGRQDPRSKASG